MKKFIFTLAAFCAAAASVTCLNACEFFGGNGEDKNDYEPLNEMLSYNYSQISLKVTNTFDDGFSLVSEYDISYSDDSVTVSYSIERFAQVSLDGPASELKTTVTGEKTLKAGDALRIDSTALTISADVAERGMNFKKEYFTNADLTGMWLKADVKDASGFMGSELTCSDMKVEAYFMDVFYNMNVTYKTESGNSVKIEYLFTV